MDETRPEAAWNGLDELRPALYAYLTRRCRDWSEVEDVAQETLLRAARYRRSLASDELLRPWALRIAGNVLADHVRREQRVQRETGELALASLGVDERDPAAAGEAEAELSVGNWRSTRGAALGHMCRALAGLRAADQRVLWSYYGGRRSCRDTARECGIEPALVKVRLFRARRRLLRHLRRRIALDPASEIREVSA